MKANTRWLRLALAVGLTLTLGACQRTIFQSAPTAATACDAALVGRWLSQGDRPDESGELEAIVGTDCSLQVIEHERGGSKRAAPTTLRNGVRAGVRYLWLDAAWANRSFEIEPTVLDREGDVYLFAYRLRRDVLELAAPPHRALAHRVLDKDIAGEVLMQGEELAVRVSGDTEATAKILRTHRLFRFEQPLRFKRADTEAVQ